MRVLYKLVQTLKHATNSFQTIYRKINFFFYNLTWKYFGQDKLTKKLSCVKHALMVINEISQEFYPLASLPFTNCTRIEKFIVKLVNKKWEMYKAVWKKKKKTIVNYGRNETSRDNLVTVSKYAVISLKENVDFVNFRFSKRSKCTK